MRKKQKVRILKDNSIGTITDSTFFTLGGKKYIRYEVTKPGEKAPQWYPSDKLGAVTETIKVAITDEKGQTLFAHLTIDYTKNKLNVHITGTPENLKEHKGMHFRVMSCFLQHLSDM